MPETENLQLKIEELTKLLEEEKKAHLETKKRLEADIKFLTSTIHQLHHNHLDDDD